VARLHGKSGVVYVGIASGAVASPIAYLTNWDINFMVDQPEVTAFGDLNKIYVSGLPDASGSFTGWFDDQSRQLYTAARDGIARNFYLYPNTVADPLMYWFGQILPDFSITGGVAEAIGIKANWKASTNVIKYDPVGGYL
jgi:hypothetical protein